MQSFGIWNVFVGQILDLQTLSKGEYFRYPATLPGQAYQTRTCSHPSPCGNSHEEGRSRLVFE